MSQCAVRGQSAATWHCAAVGRSPVGAPRAVVGGRRARIAVGAGVARAWRGRGARGCGAGAMNARVCTRHRQRRHDAPRRARARAGVDRRVQRGECNGHGATSIEQRRRRGGRGGATTQRCRAMLPGARAPGRAPMSRIARHSCTPHPRMNGGGGRRRRRRPPPPGVNLGVRACYGAQGGRARGGRGVTRRVASRRRPGTARRWGDRRWGRRARRSAGAARASRWAWRARAWRARACRARVWCGRYEHTRSHASRTTAAWHTAPRAHARRQAGAPRRVQRPRYNEHRATTTARRVRRRNDMAMPLSSAPRGRAARPRVGAPAARRPGAPARLRTRARAPGRCRRGRYPAAEPTCPGLVLYARAREARAKRTGERDVPCRRPARA